LPLEEVQQCYQKLITGDKLKWQVKEEKKTLENEKDRQKEVEFFKFRHEYYKNRQMEESSSPGQDEADTGGCIQ
jgi:hypothetical protein